MTLTPEGVEPLRGGHFLRVEQLMKVSVLGRTVELGFGQFEFVDFHIASEDPAPDQPGHAVVRIEPNSADAANVFQRLVKEPTQARQ